MQQLWQSLCLECLPYLFDHQRLHNGEKSYDCSECGGVFILNKSLVLLSALERVSMHAKTVVKSLAPTETFLTARLHNGRSHMNVQSVGKPL